MRHIYFRTSFGTDTGLGHLMRVNRIANYFRDKGFECNILLDNKNVGKKVLQKINHKIIYLYKNSIKQYNEIKDANKTISEVRKGSLVFVDDYRARIVWQNQLKEKGFRSVKISDFIKEKNLSHFIINTKLDFLKNSVIRKYKELNSKSHLMLGPKYSMIDNKFKILKEKKNKFKIAFYLGGAGDVKILSNIILSLIKQINLNNFYFYVVVGPFSKKVDYLNNLKSYKKNIKIIKNNLNIFKVINHVDLFVGSAGVSIFETSLYKIPSIFFKVSKNQEIDRDTLSKIGHYFLLEKNHLNEKEKIAKFICLIYKNYQKIKLAVRKSEFQIDEDGVKRIFDFVVKKIKIEKKEKKSTNKNKSLFYQKTEFKDINSYLQVRNRDHNLKASLNKKKIDILDHYIWWLNNNRENYSAYNNGKIFVFFYHDIYFFGKKKIIVPGWMSSENKPNFILVIKMLLIQYRILKKIKNKTTLGFIVKGNDPMMSFAKKLNWKELEKSNKLYSQMRKKFKFNRDVQVLIR